MRLFTRVGHVVGDDMFRPRRTILVFLGSGETFTHSSAGGQPLVRAYWEGWTEHLLRSDRVGLD